MNKHERTQRERARKEPMREGRCQACQHYWIMHFEITGCMVNKRGAKTGKG